MNCYTFSAVSLLKKIDIHLSSYGFKKIVVHFKCMNFINFSADFLADQNGSVDAQRITLMEETRLQPLIDHANV